jgi:copper chaperone
MPGDVPRQPVRPGATERRPNRRKSVSAKNETLLKVEGMSCGSCVRHVNEALRALEGIAEVDVRLQAGEVLVRHDQRAGIDAMLAAIRDAGYEPSLSNTTERP